MSEQSLQLQWSPQGVCFGCGPANERGLRIDSFVRGDRVVCSWHPEPHHHAFPGVMNGGIIGALLDCHSNWSAAWSIMQARGDERIPCTVTANFAVKLRRPTPMDSPVQLEAWATEVDGPKATIEATLTAGGKVCATCTGLFVAVEEGHPAYHRW